MDAAKVLRQANHVGAVVVASRCRMIEPAAECEVSASVMRLLNGCQLLAGQGNVASIAQEREQGFQRRRDFGNLTGCKPEHFSRKRSPENAVESDTSQHGI